MSLKVTKSFTLPNGVVVRNRFAKGAMTEGLADPDTNLPNESHCRLYKRWAEGGLGISITGNVQVDNRYMEAPRNVVLQEGTDLESFKKWAVAMKTEGCLAIMQVSHPGRQCPTSVTTNPIAPSAVALEMPGMPFKMSQLMCRAPREMTQADIDEVIQRFTTAAVLAEKAGFDGVQLHGAHGYLLSAFLSPLTNRRNDQWGGSAENRRRLLHTIIKSVRENVSPNFVLMVKLNSADFQRGGFEEGESLKVLASLEGVGVDAVEISGGTYEHMEALQAVKKESTRKREAFFLEFAKKAREVTTIPVMLTGGFAKLETMEEALIQDVDFIGIGRPLCTDVNAPQKLMSGDIKTMERFDPCTGVAAIDGPFGAAVGTLWHREHLINFSKETPDPNLAPNCWWILNFTMVAVYMWDPMKNRKKTACYSALVLGLCAAFAYLRM
eukprot:TRINITY_DN219_c1_g2_i1.p1 TRINITY_DN219_c1_g2~~TRINITY_DN219_c1_g2_i1.p1  ORF type:complete len:452 (+),score=128.98 TRINITY_DN219_c1_g2_i1:41-1357(+)